MLLAFFSFLALALAPLATSAAAAPKACSPGMMSEHGTHGQMPAEHAATDHADPCCVGMASALPASNATMVAPMAIKPLVAVSAITKFRGIRPAVADPPPRA
jgi:hypothetical protein